MDIKEYHKQYYKKHKEEYLKRTKEWRKNNTQKYLENNRKYRIANNEKLKKLYQMYYDNERKIIFEHYGKECKCCKENEFEFLTLDHINNDGNKLTKNQRKHLYNWVIKNNFPADLQTMCYNCNYGKRVNGGVCPHETELH